MFRFFIVAFPVGVRRVYSSDFVLAVITEPIPTTVCGAILAPGIITHLEPNQHSFPIEIGEFELKCSPVCLFFNGWKLVSITS